MALFRRGARDTSIEAAESINLPKLELMVYGAIRNAREEGLTADELLDHFTGYSYSSITARPSALRRKGLVVDSGERRLGRSGRKQAVLIASEYARPE